MVAGSACEAKDVRPERVAVTIQPDDGDGPLIARIEHARLAVDVTIYELSSPRIVAALEAAAVRGLVVRVLCDRNQALPQVVESLRRAGAEVRSSSDGFVNTHQKTVTIDREVSFVFSGNLDGRAFVRGRNYGVFDDDPDDVADLEELFDADWTSRPPAIGCTRLVVAPQNARARILGLLAEARQRIDVEALYITDREVEEALVTAHERGVAVRVLFNDPSFGLGDVRPTATRLLARGIPVRRSGDRFVHAKLLVADRTWAFIGSENFSRTALDRNREVGIFVSEEDGDVERVAGTFDGDWERSPAFD